MHNFTSFAFVAGLVLIIVIFFRDNLPAKVDIDWVKQGGGFIKNEACSRRHASISGEKLVYWLSLAAGIAVSRRAFCCCFPSTGPTSPTCRSRRCAHAVVAVLFIALILGHIYIGTLGMEGAFEAMGTGEVDLNWAKEHHDLWLAQQLAKRRPAAAFGDAGGISGRGARFNDPRILPRRRVSLRPARADNRRWCGRSGSARRRDRNLVRRRPRRGSRRTS